MTDWKEITLGETAELIRGVSYRPSDLVVSNVDGVALLRATNIKDKTLDLSDVLYVPSDFVRDSQLLKRFDVVIAMSSGSLQAVGRLAPLRKEWVGCVGAFCAIIRPNYKIVDPQFLDYILQTPAFRRRIESFAEGTAIMNLSRERLLNYKFSFPLIEEQKEIAGVLSSLDDKIEFLREENKTLETTAQTVFKEWFVNFNFPNAEDKPYKSSGGKMIGSELGEIPEGWRVGAYKDIVDVVTGKGIKKENLKDQGLYQVLGANGEIGKTDEYLFGEDLILTGRVGTLGTVYISRDKAWISDNVLISKPKMPENFYFAYLNLKRFNLGALNRGSTQPLITQTDLKNVDIVLPDSEILKSWHALSSQLFSKIFTNSSQIQTLSTLRDTLLPRLMSGEIRI